MIHFSWHSPLYLSWQFNNPGSNFTQELNRQQKRNLCKELENWNPINLTFLDVNFIKDGDLLLDIIKRIKLKHYTTLIGLNINNNHIIDYDINFLNNYISYLNINLYWLQQNNSLDMTTIKSLKNYLSNYQCQYDSFSASFYVNQFWFKHSDEIVEYAHILGVDRLNIINDKKLNNQKNFSKAQAVSLVGKHVANSKDLKIHYVEPQRFFARMKNLQLPNPELFISHDGITGLSPYINYHGPAVTKQNLQSIWDQYYARFNLQKGGVV